MLIKWKPRYWMQIRKLKLLEGEAGGITQHIGVSVVNTTGNLITFLDTLAMKLFTSMRERGEGN